MFKFLRTAVFHCKVFCEISALCDLPLMGPTHCQKKVNDIPIYSWDVTLAENNLIIPGQGEFG